ncbi:hypothetical protein F8M41_018863 [Gigaspora margarita]|uniref:Uncharacterized protein n=1 Tax=Gigaspora margarita TaxID=4874 RepID=A0A8H4AKU6_GIGMA|nr:hypothetical protein F8M41_018863 [Gigaspora margarita]
MVDSFTRTQPKEVSINGYNMINAKFIALKDPVLNHFTSNFSDKEQEKFWHEITIAPEEIQPEAEISWPNSIEINFIRKIIPNDVATITCQITSPLGKNIQVPGALIDSGANCSLKSKGLAKLIGMNIDKNKKPSFQRKIFKPEINLSFHKQDLVQVSTDSSRPEGSLLRNSPSNKDNNVLLEKWHAPAGFSPDFSLSSEDDSCKASN